MPWRRQRRLLRPERIARPRGGRPGRWRTIDRRGRGRLKPDFQLADGARKLLRVEADVLAGQHPVGLELRPGAGRRRLAVGNFNQPEIDLRGRQPPQPAVVQLRAAQQRNPRLVVFVGLYQQATRPAGGQRRSGPLVDLTSQHARSLGLGLPQSSRLGDLVPETPGPDLALALFQEHLLPAVQSQLPALQVVGQPLAAAFHVLGGCADYHGISLGLDPPGLKVGKRYAGLGLRDRGGPRRNGRLVAPAGKLDREQVAVDLFAGTVGEDADYIDLFVKRGHLHADVKAKRSPAGDLDRQLRRSAQGPRCRL